VKSRYRRKNELTLSLLVIPACWKHASGMKAGTRPGRRVSAQSDAWTGPLSPSRRRGLTRG
jgi:hypothetical protein